VPRCQGCVDAERERLAKYAWSLRDFEARLRGCSPVPCEGCGRPVVNLATGHYRVRTLCSDRCAWTVRNERLKDERIEARQQKVCPVCGETFDGSRRDTVTCSPKCRQKAYRQRNRTAPEGPTQP
jgi:hypothetical protein